MKQGHNKYIVQALITVASIVLLSLLYALFQPSLILGLADGLFSLSGIVLAISGFRYLNNMGAYRIYALILYKFKRRFSMTNLSKRQAYVDEKTAESEGKPEAEVGDKKEAGDKEKNYEDFAYKPVVKDASISSMFYSSLLLFILSILLGFML